MYDLAGAHQIAKGISSDIGQPDRDAPDAISIETPNQAEGVPVTGIGTSIIDTVVHMAAPARETNCGVDRRDEGD